jgi:putative toxin-antitoxin system antitoxin component (TIGR02293 family)
MATATTVRAPQTFSEELGIDLPSIEAGLSLGSLSSLVELTGMTWADVYQIVIPARTLKHRRAKRQVLSVDESDRVARVARIFDHAMRVFGDLEKARLWLQRPKQRFDGRSPLHMLALETGGRMVEEMLGQIEYGFFA